jgi:hypothetical protein
MSFVFWNRKNSLSADEYVRRIHRIMFFATSLAGKNKSEVVQALRDGLGIKITNAEDSEDRTWIDSAIDDLVVSFLMDFNEPLLVSQIQISGYGVIGGLFVCVNGLEKAEPRRINFSVDISGSRSRPATKLAKIVGEKLMRHSDFESETFGTLNILLQRNRNL